MSAFPDNVVFNFRAQNGVEIANQVQTLVESYEKDYHSHLSEGRINENCTLVKYAFFRAMDDIAFTSEEKKKYVSTLLRTMVIIDPSLAVSQEEDRGTKRYTALALAVQIGNLDLIKTLIAKGAGRTINDYAFNDPTQTALNMALFRLSDYRTRRGVGDLAAILIENGADLNVKIPDHMGFSSQGRGTDGKMKDCLGSPLRQICWNMVQIFKRKEEFDKENQANGFIEFDKTVAAFVSAGAPVTDIPTWPHRPKFSRATEEIIKNAEMNTIPAAKFQNFIRSLLWK